MSYKVIHYFEDLQDFNHPYKAGDEFPRLGLKVTETRLQELSGRNNKQGKPLIAKVADHKVEVVEDAKTEYTKTEINRMSTADLKELAEKNGLDNSLSGAELKKLLINHYGL